jgi:hypothetical protein
MAGLVPAIHAFRYSEQGVDARHKAGHDGEAIGASQLGNALAGAEFGIQPKVPRDTPFRRPHFAPSSVVAIDDAIDERGCGKE